MAEKRQTVMICLMSMRLALFLPCFLVFSLAICKTGRAQDDGPQVPAMPAAPVEAEDNTATLPPEEAAANPVPGGGLVFLELYTAESCAFCPSAERIFNDILAGDNVIGMSCVVDYFDSGAPSPLSRPFCREQQAVYSRMMRTGSLYTPQLVVNGAWQAPGHNLQKVTDAIQQARGSTSRPAELFVQEGSVPGDYDVLLPAMRPDPKQPGEKFLLRIIMLKRVPDLPPLSGQNQRRERAPYHAARVLIEGGLWDGRKTVWAITLPPESGAEASDAFLVLVQDRDNGHVLAAGQHVLPRL